MASLEDKGTKVINKFNKVNFNVWKFKLEMIFVFVGLREIVDESKKTPPSSADSKMKK